MAGYTTLDDLDFPSIAQDYGLHEPQAEPLKGGAANSSFRLVAAEGEFVLTILDNHDPLSAERLAAHTQTLRAAGVPTAEVVPDTAGNLVVHSRGKSALLKRWIEGQVVDPLPEHQVRLAGGLLAGLHNLPIDLMDLPAGTRRLSDEQTAGIDRFADRGFASWLTGRLAVVRTHEADHQRRPAICHGDLFVDNLICHEDGSLSVIDWETVSLDDPLLDLGMAAVGLAQEGGRLSSERLRLLVEGYTAVRPLSDEDRRELPAEIVHAALIIAFHRYYRHNVRFPDPAKAGSHQQVVDFVESVDLSV